ncbi:MAG: TonB-dependent receptor [Hyphomonadaceae bacterium]|nr:TonB-dependent receptor [Hyphomonadaceae bacterium]
MLEAQGRFDRDNRRQTISNSQSGQILDQRTGTFERFQPRLGASLRLTDQIIVYSNYGEAFRPGGFNPTPGPIAIWNSAFRPEITTSFEIGAKLRNLPWSGRVEIAAFANEVSDFQNYTFIDGQSVTLNVDEVTIDGFEVSSSVELGQGGSIRAYLCAHTCTN